MWKCRDRLLTCLIKSPWKCAFQICRKWKWHKIKKFTRRRKFDLRISLRKTLGRERRNQHTLEGFILFAVYIHTTGSPIKSVVSKLKCTFKYSGDLLQDADVGILLTDTLIQLKTSVFFIGLQSWQPL